MAGITLLQAQQKLDNAMDALDRAMTAQEHQVSTSTGGRRTQYAPLKDLQAAVTFWDGQVKLLSRGNRMAGYSAVPL